MKKKLAPLLAVIFMIIVIVLIFVVGSRIEGLIPSSDEADIRAYFGSPENGQYAVVLDYEVQEFHLYDIDGRVYMGLNTLKSRFNDRFYWDEKESVLLYATPGGIVSAYSGEKGYYDGRTLISTNYPIVRQSDGYVYVDLEFIRNYTFLDYEIVEESPSRILLWHEVTELADTVAAEKETAVRIEADIKAPILTTLTIESEPVYLLEEGDGFDRVMTADGITGFVRRKDLSGTVNAGRVREEVDYGESAHLLLDDTICMIWHQVTSSSVNTNIADVLTSVKGVNVVSPTWFYINDNKGNLADVASKDYVNYCHAQGVKVWALVSNLENTDVDSTYILTHTSVRQNLVNQIVSAAIQYDLDGINVDLEALSSDVGEGYIQFIRELSLKCHDNGITVSVDNYVPSDYTSFYDREEQAIFADYIVVMAYDEHYYGSDEGSVASIGFLRDAIGGTIQRYHVPKRQVIQGNPFYTRVWKETPKDEATDTAEAAADDYVNYTLTSEAVSMQDALNRLAANGAEITYLSDIGQNYGAYEKDGNTYKIWLEDETSVENRMEIFQEFGVGGVAFWKVGLEKDGIWDIILRYL